MTTRRSNNNKEQKRASSVEREEWRRERRGRGKNSRGMENEGEVYSPGRYTNGARGRLDISYCFALFVYVSFSAQSGSRSMWTLSPYERQSRFPFCPNRVYDPRRRTPDSVSQSRVWTAKQLTASLEASRLEQEGVDLPPLCPPSIVPVHWLPFQQPLRLGSRKPRGWREGVFVVGD